MQAIRSSINSKKHSLTVSVPAELPELLVDPVQIEHVFVELLDSAHKFTPMAGGMAVRLQ